MDGFSECGAVFVLGVYVAGDDVVVLPVVFYDVVSELDFSDGGCEEVGA